ncbi:hypothetical protein FPCIR_10095 [Fusarium pseudocircinatum]|uniref:Uncharacterized protein n=1 Tax=Fusarium pseudocircinatum TaxID=56676 RepID=A0A8H5L0L7_9HYPO|nr:hypothetical protein FPCIR_10095 [Fusarium pseudocircinatum]
MVQSIEMNPQQTSMKNTKWMWDGEHISQDEFFRRSGPEGCRHWVEKGQAVVNDFGPHAAKNPAETAHDNIQQRGNTKAERASNTKSSQDMDNVRKIGRLMERIEVLEAENRALKKKNAEFEDKNRSLKRKNTEFEDKQAKMVKLLTDD